MQNTVEELSQADKENAPNPNTLSKVELREMIQCIEMMQDTDQYQIFNIIKQDTNKYTENRNGVFINLEHLDDETLHKIAAFVQYWKLQKITIETTENKTRCYAESFATNVSEATTQHSDAYESNVDTQKQITKHLETETKRELESNKTDVSVSTKAEKHLVQVNMKTQKTSLHKGKKHRFEGSAARVVRKCLQSNE
jgi:hypothetical protein